jgi:Type II secretion system (T2SS), protein G
MIHFTCPHCQKHLQADDSEAGTFIPCPGCENVVPLPGKRPGGKAERNLRMIAYGSVVCVLLAMAAVFGWRYFGTDFKTTVAQMKIREITQACQRYWIDHDGQFPFRLEELASRDEDGKGPYLNQQDILDPWGRPFHYELNENESSGATSSTPKIYCDAPDGSFIGSGNGK